VNVLRQPEGKDEIIMGVHDDGTISLVATFKNRTMVGNRKGYSAVTYHKTLPIQLNVAGLTMSPTLLIKLYCSPSLAQRKQILRRKLMKGRPCKT
jgi:hypothetical protein